MLHLLKKLLIGLAVFSLSAGGSHAPAAAAGDADPHNTPAYRRLLSLGILTGEDTVDDYLTRAQLAGYLVRITGHDAQTLSGRLPFRDVSANDKDYGYINAAYQLGYMNGVSPDTFDGKGYVTYQQAVKCMVSALGYEPIALARGGYPTGYAVVGAELGILRGVSHDQSGNISMADFLTLLMQTLETNLLEETSMGPVSTHEVYRGVTLLTKVFYIYSLKGVMDANPYTTLIGESSLPAGSVRVADTVLSGADYDHCGFIGRYVQAYYRRLPHEDAKTLLLLENYEKMGEVTTLSLADIEDAGEAKAAYLDRETQRLQEISLSGTVSLIHNEKRTAYTPGRLLSGRGSVSFIDHNADGVTDVIVLRSYDAIVVDGVSEKTYSVAGKQTAGINLRPHDRGTDVVILKNGTPLDFAQIREWDVINYYESERTGRSAQVLLVGGDTAAGTVTALTDETLTLDESDTREITPALKESLSIGTNGRFFADLFGTVFFADITPPEMVYGFLNGIKPKGIHGYELRIFTENNRWVALFAAPRLRHNGSSVDSAAFLGPLSNAGYRNLIQYRVNSEGAITELNTPLDITAASILPQKEKDEAVIRNKFRLSASIPSASYRYNTRSFNNQVYLTDETMVFMVPTDLETASESEFFVQSRDHFYADQAFNKISVYNADETFAAPVCVSQGSVVTVSGGNSFMIVSGLRTVLDDDGMEVYGIAGTYNQYHDVLMYTRDKEVVNAVAPLEAGDIIQFTVDNNGTVSKVSVVYRISDGISKRSVSLYSSSAIVLGVVQTIDRGSARMVVDYSPIGAFELSSMLKTVYLYDKVNKRVQLGGIGDIEPGDQIIGSFSYYRAKELVVIKANGIQ